MSIHLPLRAGALAAAVGLICTALPSGQAIGQGIGPAEAVNDAAAAPQDTALDVAAPGVLANDQVLASEPGAAPYQVCTVAPGFEGDFRSLSPRIVSDPGKGTLTLSVDGSYRFVPAAGFVGTVMFDYSLANIDELPQCPINSRLDATLTIDVVATAQGSFDGTFTPVAAQTGPCILVDTTTIGFGDVPTGSTAWVAPGGGQTTTLSSCSPVDQVVNGTVGAARRHSYESGRRRVARSHGQPRSIRRPVQLRHRRPRRDRDPPRNTGAGADDRACGRGHTASEHRSRHDRALPDRAGGGHARVGDRVPIRGHLRCDGPLVMRIGKGVVLNRAVRAIGAAAVTAFVVAATIPSLAFADAGVGIDPGEIVGLPPIEVETATVVAVTVRNPGSESAAYRMLAQPLSGEPELAIDPTWFSFTPATFDIGGGAAQEVQVAFTVPEGTGAGDYLALITAQLVLGEPESPGAQVGAAVATKFYFTVPTGAAPSSSGVPNAVVIGIVVAALLGAGWLAWRKSGIRLSVTRDR